MRELKFRQWKDERMSYFGYLKDKRGIYSFTCSQSSALDRHPVMQYTGLKDKNGVEIYCDDILAFDGYEWNKDCGFSDKDYIFRVIQENTGEWCGAGICTEWPEFCKVIGNIYENPELLNEN